MDFRDHPDDPLFAPGQPPRARRGASALTALTFIAAVGGLAYALAPRRSGGSRLALDGEALALDERAARPQVERSLTIEGHAPEALAERWAAPETLPRLMAAVAEVESLGPERTRWRAPGLGEWTMRRHEEPLAPGRVVRWVAEQEDAPLKTLAARFHPAHRSRDTIVKLHLSMDPPGGALGRSVLRLGGDLLPGMVATKALHFFKALVQAGEIPTTKGQPAARRVEH